MANRVKIWWQRHAPSKRRLIQLYAALLYNAHLKGYLSGEIYTGPVKSICVPGLNCYSCPAAVAACPLGALQNALASSATRAPTYVLGILMLFGLTLGRTICGWLCPFGLIQELLHKIPVPKLQKNRVTRALSKLKYVLLVVFVLILPLYYGLKSIPLPAFCKTICPAGTLEGAVALLLHPANTALRRLLGSLFALKLSLLILILLSCMFLYRAFCRFLCPLGAIYGLFNRIALFGITVEPTKCVDCGKCLRQCKMDILHVGDSECIQCGECVGACPTQAIHTRISLHGSKKRRLAVAAIVLAVLFCWVNLPQKSSVPVGSAVGERCPEFSVALCPSGSERYTPAEHKGRVRVINFWATWCTPCVHELPSFQKLYENYGNRIDVLAVHADMITEDVDAWIQAHDYTLPFATDDQGEALAALGGGNILPVTVIIDSEDVIVYNATGSMSYSALEEIIKPLL